MAFKDYKYNQLNYLSIFFLANTRNVPFYSNNVLSLKILLLFSDLLYVNKSMSIIKISIHKIKKDTC